MNIRYTGPARDYSGYGEACRHDIAALLSAGHDLTIETTHHCLEYAEFGELGKMVTDREYRKLDYRVKIIHTTPNIFNQFIEEDKYHIGRVFWETNKLPPDFAAGAQLCDEIWTGSKYNAQAIEAAGVTKPIYIVPEAIVSKVDRVRPFNIEVPAGLFKFYSIFEWTARKNPTSLIKAYLNEFLADDKVALVMKVFLDNFLPEKKRMLIDAIKEIKKDCPNENPPPIYVCLELLDRNQIYRYHETFDCFVSAHRGEGWGIPQMEALIMGKPVISTACGGIHEYIDDVALLVDYSLVPIRGNDKNAQWYREDQKWAEVNINQLRKQMRYAYENQTEAKKLGEKGKQKATELFDIKSVGVAMTKQLNRIAKKLGIDK